MVPPSGHGPALGGQYTPPPRPQPRTVHFQRAPLGPPHVIPPTPDLISRPPQVSPAAPDLPSGPPPAEAGREIQLTVQAPEPPGALPDQDPDATGYRIKLDTPGPEQLFRLESERFLKERMRQEARSRGRLQPLFFPEDPVVTREPYQPRHFPPLREVVEPNYVCFQRLYFQQVNAERYGWELGYLQMFISAGEFYWDVFWLPYHWGSEPCRHHECSRGYCLPGDPVPYLCYPVHISLSGIVVQAGAMGAAFAIFP